MKVQDLLREAIQVANDAGDNVTNDCFAELTQILEDGEKSLRKKEGKDTSYSINPTMRASVSGSVRLVKNYTSHGAYNSTSHWDYCLQVGNGIDGNALDEVTKLFGACKELVKEYDPGKLQEHSGVFHAYFGDGSISCIYEYARNFCWIGIRKSEDTIIKR